MCPSPYCRDKHVKLDQGEYPFDQSRRLCSCFPSRVMIFRNAVVCRLSVVTTSIWSGGLVNAPFDSDHSARYLINWVQSPTLQVLMEAIITSYEWCTEAIFGAWFIPFPRPGVPPFPPRLLRISAVLWYIHTSPSLSQAVIALLLYHCNYSCKTCWKEVRASILANWSQTSRRSISKVSATVPSPLC